MRTTEVYDLTCACGEEVTIATTERACPKCGVALNIQFRGEMPKHEPSTLERADREADTVRAGTKCGE